MGLAYFNMSEPAAQPVVKRWLYQLPGLRFWPKVEPALDLGLTGSALQHFLLPVTPLCWQKLRLESRKKVIERLYQLAERERIDHLAIDRSQKALWQDYLPEIPVYFGDFFFTVVGGGDART